MFRWLKPYMPRRLYARAALILIVPMLVLQLVVSITFLQRHFEDVTRQLTLGVALELARLQVAANGAADGATARAILRQEGLAFDMAVSLLDDGAGVQTQRAIYDISGVTVISTLRERLPSIAGIDLLQDERRARVALPTRHGGLVAEFDRQRVSASNPHQLLVLMIIVGGLMTVIAFLFLRNQLRPIKRLGRAAEAFGKGQSVPYRPSGAVEVRAAGQAFLDMRARIERQIEQRTMMLSGVSHDLRTPLTRMRLELSLMEPGPEIAALEHDLAEMETLLEAFLAYAREDATEPRVQTDPGALLQAAMDRAQRGGGHVDIGQLDTVSELGLQQVGVARALDNLIGNALRYGNCARVSLIATTSTLTFRVEDDGPGIPADSREQAMKPFARLDAARNQNRGSGVGLGLAIAADVARGHGGLLRLGESRALGGLQADLVLAR